MATAGAVIGLAVPGVGVENVATIGKTLTSRMWRPAGAADVAGDVACAIGRGRDEDDVRDRPGQGLPAADPDGPEHEDADAAIVVTVDRGRLTCLVEAGTASASARSPR